MGVHRTCSWPQVTFEAITFEPIKIQTCLAPQKDRLNLSFVKDEHKNGEKMARNFRNTVIYKGTFISNHSLFHEIKASFETFLQLDFQFRPVTQ